jgi:phosphoenolpyruvate synthase/pyruvate phosphate dikinase
VIYLPMSKYIRSFLEIGLHDVGLVGGKTASLGGLYSTLASEGVAVPNDFAVTANACRDALSQPGIAASFIGFSTVLTSARSSSLRLSEGVKDRGSNSQL